jgi:hypothetical protein
MPSVRFIADTTGLAAPLPGCHQNMAPSCSIPTRCFSHAHVVQWTQVTTASRLARAASFPGLRRWSQRRRIEGQPSRLSACGAQRFAPLVAPATDSGSTAACAGDGGYAFGFGDGVARTQFGTRLAAGCAVVAQLERARRSSRMATIRYQPAPWLIQRPSRRESCRIHSSTSAYLPASVGTCTALSSVSSSMS